MTVAAKRLAFRLRVAYLLVLAVGVLGLLGAGTWVKHLLVDAEQRQNLTDVAGHLGSTGLHAVEDSILAQQSQATGPLPVPETTLERWKRHSEVLAKSLATVCATHATVCERFELLSRQRQALENQLEMLNDGRSVVLSNRERLLHLANLYHRDADLWATDFDAVLDREGVASRNRFLTTVLLISIPLALLSIWIFETRIRHLADERRRADEWTTEREQRAAVAEWTHHPVFITNSTGVITWANDAFTALTGYTTAHGARVAFPTLLGAGMDNPDDLPFMLGQLAEGAGFQREILQRKADGTPFWGSIDCRPYRTTSDELAGFVVIDSDITGRKSAEAAQKNSDSRLRHLADSLPCMISAWDAHAVCEFANAAHRQTFGVDPATMVGRLIDDIFGSDMMGDARDKVDRVLAGEPQRYEQNLPMTDGTRRAFTVDLVPQRHGGHGGGFYVVTNDVTEFRENQRTIERQTALLNATSSIAGVGGWEITLASRDLVLSDTVFEIYGLPAGSAPTPAEIAKFLPPDEARRHRSALRRAVGQGQPYDLVLEFHNARAQRRWVRAVGVPIMQQGHCERIIGALQDVTSMREAELTLERARDAAEAANVAKGQFLANMSHEIRTPMNGIIGMLDLLEQHDLSADARQMLETAQSSADALLTVINDILDFSKIEAGKLTLEHIEVPIRRLAEDVALLFSQQASAKGVEVICAINNGVPDTILGDPTRLRQVLANLLGNAVKFTEQGHVLLDIQLGAGDGLACQPSTEDPTNSPMLQISIRDSGIGMDEAAQRRLFHTFVQADGSTTRKYGGTGLGLAITKRLIESMKGSIEVKSALGAGSTFRVTIPLEAGTNPDSNAGEATLNGIRVLVVDDNPINRCVFEHYLQWRGVRHHSSCSAREGLAELQEAAVSGSPYDVVLLDYQMPDMDGLGFLHRLREGTTAADTPCVVLSSLGDRIEGIDHLNVAAWLTKPVRKLDLYKTLAMVTGRSTASRDPVTPPSAAVSKEWSALRVLVAEDNIVNQMVARRVLQSYGIEATVCADGEAAFVAVQSGAFDLVFMDCQMPHMDGYECTRAIRDWENSRRGNIARLPIIAMTANALTGDREKCLDAGMDDYVSKPIKRDTVQAMLQRWRPVPPDLRSASS